MTGALVALALLPAFGGQGATVTASDFLFSPEAVTITAGETVTFGNDGGIHNFAFADGQRFPADPTPSTDPVWDGPLSRTFAQAGSYAFRCDLHPVEMNGTVTVTAPGGTTPAPPGSPPPAPPAPGNPPADPGTPGAAPLEVRTLRTAGRRFCVRRCRRPGVRIEIELTRPATVAGTLTRRGRRFGRVRLGTVPAGPRTLRFSRTAAGRRLIPGRYALALTIDGTIRRTLRFRVR